MALNVFSSIGGTCFRRFICYFLKCPNRRVSKTRALFNDAHFASPCAKTVLGAILHWLVHSSILTPENTELLHQSIATFVFTLKNIESITSDIYSFTGDEATRRNLKSLIRSLSRLL